MDTFFLGISYIDDISTPSFVLTDVYKRQLQENAYADYLELMKSLNSSPTRSMSTAETVSYTQLEGRIAQCRNLCPLPQRG